MEGYRRLLLDAGMAEPTKRKPSGGHWFFYRPVTEWTAFIVNLTGNDDCVEVVYGYASTAFTRMAGDENAIVEWGVSDEGITIREKTVICDEVDEAAARLQITQMYERYLQTQKDALLAEAKEKRKAFLQQIAVQLKPWGFRKKAGTWTRSLEGGYDLMFNAQKSAFSDTYYFNISIAESGMNDRGSCYYTRVFPGDMCPVDWQALGRDEFELFLNRSVVPALEQIINTPLRELGKLPSIWSCCSCDRKKCEPCWVEKNRWEAKGT